LNVYVILRSIAMKNLKSYGAKPLRGCVHGLITRIVLMLQTLDPSPTFGGLRVTSRSLC
jgi:hypothetical protein